MTDRLTGLPGGFRGLPRTKAPMGQRPLAGGRGVPLRFRGPRELRLGQVERVNGPGESPSGFNGAGTSEDEWIWYWASGKALTPEQDPREPPYEGDRTGTLWEYQTPYRASGSIGGARIDFLYHLADEDVGVRIQSSRFHTLASAEIKAYDLEQLLTLSARFRVDDAYSQDFVEDPTGAAAIVELKRILAGGNAVNPINAGTARTTRLRV